MRRFLVSALAICVLALTACGSNDADSTGVPAAVGASPTDSQADADYGQAVARANCAEAEKVSKDGAAAFDADVEKLIQLAVEGDEAKAKEAQKELRDNLTAWSETLTEMSGRPYAPVGALVEGAATVEKIADPDDHTPINPAKEALSHVGNKIRAACAGL